MPDPAAEQLVSLSESVAHLRSTVEAFDGDALRSPAYPSEWTIADTLSHLGSGAVIMQARIAAARQGHALADDFAPPVWDEWNAKTPEAKSADALLADRALLDAATAVPPEERSRLRTAFGPVELDFPSLIGLRLNEHALHTWDIEVAFDPRATVAAQTVGFVVDNLTFIAQFAGKPIGIEREVHVHSTEPARDFTISLRKDAVSLTQLATSTDPPNVELPAEALIRLVYGRLDPDHTPPVRGEAELDVLRRVFTGV